MELDINSNSTTHSSQSFKEFQQLSTTLASISVSSAESLSFIPNQFNLNNYCWWSNLIHPLITVLLCLLSVFVVLGNSLVVSAIWHEYQLHSATNYLIASLAAADCLVGAVVMPFSILSEIIIGSWTFGATWCDLWHSFDVLASTASIMNLCAISLDRYLAITDPISYPARMTPKRVAFLIVSLWTCSSLISFPAIIWWRSVSKDGPLQRLVPTTSQQMPLELQRAANYVTQAFDDSMLMIDQATEKTTATLMKEAPGKGVEIFNFNTAGSQQETLMDFSGSVGDNGKSMNLEPKLLYKCVFTDDTYYLLFSSFISFYGPLCIMLYAYYRIYKAAIRQTRFLKYGSKQVMVDNNRSSSRYCSSNQSRDSSTNCSIPANERLMKNNLVLRAHRGGANTNNHPGPNHCALAKTSLSKQNTTSTTLVVGERENEQSPNGQQVLFAQFQDQQQQQQQSMDQHSVIQIDFEESEARPPESGAQPPAETIVSKQEHQTKPVTRSLSNKLAAAGSGAEFSLESSPSMKNKKVGRKLSRLAKEKKAAKTLGIVVGVFILCWLPFFVVNIIVALCGSKYIYKFDSFVPIVTWLGWLNSAMNPVIYACWSREFRRAFRGVLLTWFRCLCPYRRSLEFTNEPTGSLGQGAGSSSGGPEISGRKFQQSAKRKLLEFSVSKKSSSNYSASNNHDLFCSIQQNKGSLNRTNCLSSLLALSSAEASVAQTKRADSVEKHSINLHVALPGANDETNRL